MSAQIPAPDPGPEAGDQPDELTALRRRVSALEAELGSRRLAAAEQRAVEDARLELALQRVRAVVLSMQREDDWDHVIRAFNDELQGLVPFNACSVNIIDLEAGTLVAYAVGPSRGVHRNVRDPIDPAVRPGFETALRTGRPWYRANRRDFAFAALQPTAVQSVLDVPFIGGTVAVNSTTESAFTPRHCEVVERFAEVVSQGYRRLGDLRALAQAEERLRQTQKLEAVGQLASGVAHDFNNLLTVICGYSELLLQTLGPEHPHHGELEAMHRAAKQGAGVVRQLLAVGRRQVLRPAPVNMNDLLDNVQKMLGRLLGEDISLVLSLEADPAVVWADEGQLQQVLLNLAVNARDAMPDGGLLRLETAAEGLEPGRQTDVPVKPGRYVKLTVSDTGMGMDSQTLSRIFEPFFTTKEPGEGTGLGLATAYGIIKQSGGYIWAHSEPGQGTTFTVYLPALDPQAAPAAETGRARSVRPAAAGGETVLVVEDDSVLCATVSRMLRHLGYQVLTAQRGEAALDVAAAHDGPIHLLLTDVVMPGMNGRQLAAALVQARPDTRVLYMSGYADGVIDRSGIVDQTTALIQKPLSLDSLAVKLREVLAW